MTIQENGPDPIDVHVGQRIRVRRIQKNMSQSAVAERMNVSFQQVQKFENAQNRVSAARLYKISRILEVPVDYFFEGLPGHYFVLPGESPAASVVEEEQTDYSLDLMSHPQSAELLKVFFQVQDAMTRRALIDFMKRLGPENENARPAILGPDGQMPKRKRGRPRKEG